MPVMLTASEAPAKLIDSVLMSAQNEGHCNTHDAASNQQKRVLNSAHAAFGAINRVIETSFMFIRFSCGTMEYETPLDPQSPATALSLLFVLRHRP